MTNATRGSCAFLNSICLNAVTTRVFYSKLLLHRSVKDTRCIDSNLESGRYISRVGMASRFLSLTYLRYRSTVPTVPGTGTYGTGGSTAVLIFIFWGKNIAPLRNGDGTVEFVSVNHRPVACASRGITASRVEPKSVTGVYQSSSSSNRYASMLGCAVGACARACSPPRCRSS